MFLLHFSCAINKSPSIRDNLFLHNHEFLMHTYVYKYENIEFSTQEGKFAFLSGYRTYPDARLPYEKSSRFISDAYVVARHQRDSRNTFRNALRDTSQSCHAICFARRGSIQRAAESRALRLPIPALRSVISTYSEREKKEIRKKEKEKEKKRRTECSGDRSAHPAILDAALAP